MNNYYIDTCSLKWRYLSGTPTGFVNSVIESPINNVYTSEITILEWSSALACAVREKTIELDVFKNNELAFFNDIAETRLKIFQAKRVIERARSWIEFVGVIHERALKSNDAIHLSAALELSSQLREPVTFLTSDEKLHKAIDSLDVFKPHLISKFLKP